MMRRWVRRERRRLPVRVAYDWALIRFSWAAAAEGMQVGRFEPSKMGDSGMRIAMILMTAAATFGLATKAQGSELRAAFEAACLRTPEIPALVARRAEVDARARAADALLPGGPWATVMHRTDALTNDRGTREYEAEFGIPIWLRGERGASLAAALTEGERLEAEIGARRLEVAKRVREAYWMVAEARERVAIAERRRSTAATLAKSMREQAGAGQVELVETKLADADARDAEVSLAGVRSELNQARIAFGVLTGFEAPAGFRESERSGATPAHHPRIVLRRAATEKALADEQLTWTVDRERPELSAFANNNTDTSAEPNVTSLGVRFKIPFSYDAVNEPKRAAAAAEVVVAQEELALAEREVGGDVAQARARLDGARKQLTGLEARRADLAAVLKLIEDAQQTGQTTFNDVIRARLQLYEADLARASARVAVERGRSDVIQTLGLEP
jgi:cobalt-zinc-cadmium efflux system outer membrane protein